MDILRQSTCFKVILSIRSHQKHGCKSVLEIQSICDEQLGVISELKGTPFVQPPLRISFQIKLLEQISIFFGGTTYHPSTWFNMSTFYSITVNMLSGEPPATDQYVQWSIEEKPPHRPWSQSVFFRRCSEYFPLMCYQWFIHGYPEVDWFHLHFSWCNAKHAMFCFQYLDHRNHFV